MNRHRMLHTATGLLVMLLLAFFAVGCAKYATDEDLGNLESARMAALASGQRVADLEAEKADLEMMIADRQAELQEVIAERASTRKRLTDQGVELPPLDEEIPAEPEMPTETVEPADIQEVPETEMVPVEQLEAPVEEPEAPSVIEEEVETAPEEGVADEEQIEEELLEEELLEEELLDEGEGLDEFQDEFELEEEEEFDDLFSLLPGGRAVR